MKAVKDLLPVFALLSFVTMIPARYIDPNCGWSDETYRAVGDWAIDAGSTSNWSSIEPLGLIQPTNAQPCEYSVDIHGLQINKEYQWKVVIGDSWNVNWGCTGRGGPNCRFTTSTGSIRLKIVGSFAYPLTSEIIDVSS